MKHHQSTTPEPAGPSLGAIAAWALSLRQVQQWLAPYFARPEVRQHALRYLQALLSDIPRKNGWQRASHARELRPYGIQRLLSRAVWDDAGVRAELRTFVYQTLHPPPLVPAYASQELLFPVLVLDESGFPIMYHLARLPGKPHRNRAQKIHNCLKRLPMLYYECRRLNGLWSPFGFETHLNSKPTGMLQRAKWPVEPVRV